MAFEVYCIPAAVRVVWERWFSKGECLPVTESHSGPGLSPTLPAYYSLILKIKGNASVI